MAAAPFAFGVLAVPVHALNCNLDASGDTLLPATADVDRLVTIIVENQTGCAGNVCDFNNDGQGPNAGDVAALLQIATTQANANNTCTTTTGATVVGAVDTGGTVSGRSASRRMAANIGDLTQLSAVLYEMDNNGNLVAVPNVAAVSMSADPTDPTSTTLKTFTFTGVPDYIINSVVRIENLGDPNAQTLQAILPGVTTTESTEMRVDLKSDKEAEVLKEVVKTGIEPKFVDPTLIKQNISSEMITSGTFDPASVAGAIKEASNTLITQFAGELGQGVSNQQALSQMLNIRRHQFNAARLKEQIAQLSATDPRRADFQQKLDSSLTRYETEVKTQLPTSGDKNGLEKFQGLQQSADAKLQANVTDPTLKATFEKRGKIQDFLRNFQTKMGFLFPAATDVNSPVSPIAILAKVNQLGMANETNPVLSLSFQFKAIFDELNQNAEDPLADSDALVTDAVGKVKNLRNQILTAGNLLSQSAITSVEATLQAIEQEAQSKFQAGETPATVDTYVRGALLQNLSQVVSDLDDRLSSMDGAARVPVKEAIRQILIALSSGRIPPHLMRDPTAPLPPPGNIAPPVDTDNDGVPDFVETKEGTDPNDPNSKPALVIVMKPGDGLDNDNDGKTDEEKGGFNGFDDDGDGKIDEDVSFDFPMTNFRGVLLRDGQPVVGALLMLTTTPPGPGVTPVYSTSIPTGSTGEFFFEQIKVGRYFLGGWIDIDGEPGPGPTDKMGFVGGAQGPMAVEIPMPNGDLSQGVFLTFPNFVISNPGAQGRFQVNLTGLDNTTPISGTMNACRADNQDPGPLANGLSESYRPTPQCIPQGMVGQNGQLSPSVAVEPGIWVIKLRFNTQNDQCYRQSVVNIQSQTSDQLPILLSGSALSAPRCLSALLNPPNVSKSTFSGVIPQFVNMGPLDESIKAGIFLEPPKHGSWVLLTGLQAVNGDGYFAINDIPNGLNFFLAFWRDFNGLSGPQQGEPMAVLVNEQNQPRIISLSADLNANPFSASFPGTKLQAISIPREISGTIIITPSTALSDSVKANVEVAACLSASSLLLGPPPPAPPGPNGPRSASNETAPPPCFFTKTDSLGQFKFFMNTGLYELRARASNGMVTFPHQVEVGPPGAPLRFGVLQPAPDPNNPNPPQPPPLLIGINGSEMFLNN